jgi:hypothetical protein
MEKQATSHNLDGEKVCENNTHPDTRYRDQSWEDLENSSFSRTHHCVSAAFWLVLEPSCSSRGSTRSLLLVSLILQGLVKIYQIIPKKIILLYHTFVYFCCLNLLCWEFLRFKVSWILISAFSKTPSPRSSLYTCSVCYIIRLFRYASISNFLSCAANDYLCREQCEYPNSA